MRMKRQFETMRAALVLATVIAVGAPAIVSAVDGAPGPFDPRLIVPIPILRRHACAADYSVPTRRGVAILSPIESPDHDCPVVGGKPLCVPYYPDYCTHGSHGPRLAIPDDGRGYCCPGSAVSGGSCPTDTLPMTATSTYGIYSGANQNESALLHLGGNAMPNPQAGPCTAPADVIDLIQTGQ
jgi:hypothetical protein